MAEFSWPEARILAVDDQVQNVNIIDRLLRRAGFDRVVTTTHPQQALPLFEEHRPDLVLLDLHMPDLDGFGVLDQLAPLLPADGYLPIVFITADADTHLKKRALSLGAKDFVNKPFDATEIVLRIRNLLEARYLYLALQAQNEMLEARVKERTEDLEQAQLEILHRLSRAADFRDDDTMQHTERVGRLSASLARELGMEDRGGGAAPPRRAAPRPREDRRARQHPAQGRRAERRRVLRRQDAHAGSARACCRAAPTRCCRWPRRSRAPTTNSGTGPATSRGSTATRSRW